VFKQLPIKTVLGIFLITMILSFGWWSPKIGFPLDLPDSEALQRLFDQLGAWGPVAVIGSMTVAILISPIPSAPIALAAGAIYGHFWGALYVIAGAEFGAIAAFSIARVLGYELLHNWIGKQLNQGLAGSQNFLMVAVFTSRLLPFISFDIVSYAAGLTSLSLWRFAIATLAGVIPLSFLLAHFGSELMADETDRILIAVLLLGMLTVIPLIVRLLIKSRQN
jgi:uncharacterized membrane protein YdjX (TVP38/TMEM64 family)